MALFRNSSSTTLVVFKCSPWYDPACHDPVSPPIKYACVQRRWTDPQGLQYGFPKFAGDLGWSGGFADPLSLFYGAQERREPAETQAPIVFTPLSEAMMPRHFVESSTINGYKVGTWACEDDTVSYTHRWKYSVFLNGPYAGLPVASITQPISGFLMDGTLAVKIRSQHSRTTRSARIHRPYFLPTWSPCHSVSL